MEALVAYTNSSLRLGDPIKVAKIQWHDVTYPHGLEPIATYKFQYRSRSEWIWLTVLLGYL